MSVEFSLAAAEHVVKDHLRNAAEQSCWVHWLPVTCTSLQRQVATELLEQLAEKVVSDARQSLSRPMLLAYRVSASDLHVLRLILPQGAVAVIRKTNPPRFATVFFPNAAACCSQPEQRFARTAMHHVETYSAMSRKLPRTEDSRTVEGEVRDHIRFISPENWGFTGALSESRHSGRIPVWTGNSANPGPAIARVDLSSKWFPMFDFVSQLRDALSSAELAKLGNACAVDAAAQDAAFAVAVALGRCRLSGQRPPEDLDGTLDAPMVSAAMAHCRWLIDFQSNWFNALVDPNSTSDDPIHEEDVCFGIVRSRHELWAATIALEEAIHQLCHAGEATDELVTAFQDLLASLGDFDALLLEHVEELAPAARVPLLENLASSVTGDYAEELPWWLDGTIKEAADAAMQAFADAMPSLDLMKGLVMRRWQGKTTILLLMAWLASQRQLRLQPRMAAAGAAEPRLVILRWQEPDADRVAEILVDESAQLPDDQPIALVFRRGDQPATEMAGTKVRLLDVPSVIKSDGTAIFRLSDLLQSAGQPQLTVGEPGSVWTPQGKGESGDSH